MPVKAQCRLYNFKDSWMQYIYHLHQISIGFVRAINNHLN